MTSFLLRLGARLGENKHMAKAKVDKKNGVTIRSWTGHPVYRWRVSFPDGASRSTKGFKTKAGADGAIAFADKKRGDIKNDGIRHEAITNEERRAVMAFREIIASLPDAVSKASLGEVVEEYRKRADVRRKSMTISELIDRYVTSLERRKLSKSHRSSTETRLRKFESDHGEWIACNISDDVAGDWLHGLDLAALTINHYRAALLQMFNHGRKIRAVETNPIEAIDKLKEDCREIGILSTAEAANLLSHSSDKILPAIAIGLFAGLRRSEIARLEWSQVNFKHEHIEVKASSFKSPARRLVPMRNNLRQWLEPYRQRNGPVMPTAMIYRSRLSSARKAAGIEKWPHNALRHSFASYNLAAFENAPALSGEMGHVSIKMIFQHYRALVLQKDAESFWSITPLAKGKSKA
ncbi:tyrosine-type recombinase/integrase [Akkermansiaceae bacterium]|nr:tyrosine-type recombinase/integrase [Akkermansiaceae bacterium]MDB4658750.1 tyrosine-type recombinase/integrase [bacterium]MDC0282361.1 tyrosine-type recombinase/integrase [Akkermansiaceae bacterium]